MHLFQTFVSNQQNDKNNFILYVIHKMRNPKYFVRKLKCESRAGYLVKFIRPVPPGKCLQNLRPRGASHRFKPKRSVLRARDVFFSSEGSRQAHFHSSSGSCRSLASRSSPVEQFSDFNSPGHQIIVL